MSFWGIVICHSFHLQKQWWIQWCMDICTSNLDFNWILRFGYQISRRWCQKIQCNRPIPISMQIGIMVNFCMKKPKNHAIRQYFEVHQKITFRWANLPITIHWYYHKYLQPDCAVHTFCLCCCNILNNTSSINMDTTLGWWRSCCKKKKTIWTVCVFGHICSKHSTQTFVQTPS